MSDNIADKLGTDAESHRRIGQSTVAANIDSVADAVEERDRFREALEEIRATSCRCACIVVLEVLADTTLTRCGYKEAHISHVAACECKEVAHQHHEFTCAHTIARNALALAAKEKA